MLKMWSIVEQLLIKCTSFDGFLTRPIRRFSFPRCKIRWISEKIVWPG